MTSYTFHSKILNFNIFFVYYLLKNEHIHQNKKTLGGGGVNHKTKLIQIKVIKKKIVSPNNIRRLTYFVF